LIKLLQQTLYILDITQKIHTLNLKHHDPVSFPKISPLDDLFPASSCCLWL